MNSLDFFLACRWLADSLPGAKVEKRIARDRDGRCSIELYSRTLGGKRSLILGKGLLGFGKPGGELWRFGRQFLAGKTVSAAGQTGFDRIFRIDFTDGSSLILEAFDGNILLLKGGRIVSCANERDWAGRSLRVGRGYLPPAGPAGLPSEKELDSSEPIGKVLAVRAGFGPEVSDRILAEAGVEKSAKSLPPAEREIVVSAIRMIFSADPSEPLAEIPAEPAAGGADASERRRTQLQARASELDAEAAEAQAKAEAILSDLAAVEERISAARAGDWKAAGMTVAGDRKAGRLTVRLAVRLAARPNK